MDGAAGGYSIRSDICDHSLNAGRRQAQGSVAVSARAAGDCPPREYISLSRMPLRTRRVFYLFWVLEKWDRTASRPSTPKASNKRLEGSGVILGAPVMFALAENPENVTVKI